MREERESKVGSSTTNLRMHMNKIVKALAGVVAAAATLSIVSPASADVVEGPVGTFTDTQTLTDKGGVDYVVSVRWNYVYNDAADVTRASVNPLVIKRADGQEGLAADAGADIHFDVYEDRPGDGLVAYQIQHVLRDNVNLDDATPNQVTYNPRNPRSNPHRTFIRVRVGTDGDGLGDSVWGVFDQPTDLKVVVS